MKIVNKKITEIHPYPDNPRNNKKAIKKVALSIDLYGFKQPIVVDKDMIIVVGHTRFYAAENLKLEKVPVLIADDLNEKQCKAYRIADNKTNEFAEWNLELLKTEFEALGDLDEFFTGFNDDEIADIFGEEINEGLTDDDSVPGFSDFPSSKEGQVYCLDRHRIMCGDSTNNDHVKLLLSDQSIDLIYSDPPYGVSYADKNTFLNNRDKGNRIQKEIKNDHLSLTETKDLWAKIFTVWSNYLADYSSYYISSPQGGELSLSLMIAMNANGFPIKHTIIWAKNNHVLGRCDYNYKHEPILYGWNKKHKFYGKGDFKTSLWNIPKPLKNDLHPTMKPVELIQNCILNSSENNQIVADMFLGSGSTLIACEKTNRICYGMELDPAYVDVIIQRWEEFTGKKAVLEVIETKVPAIY